MAPLFAALGLEPALVRAVADLGYETPTPVQVQAIPAILAGRDVLAGAQTGTGKTAGFALPLLQLLAPGAAARSPQTRRHVRALVLAPTRELAAQVEESIREYGRHVPLTSTQVFGGVGMQQQVDRLARGVDILVATPGRLLDHVRQRTVDLGRVEILVLDEADRMLDLGFINDIRRVLSLLPPKRQNLLFSATFSSDIRRLAADLLRDPAMIEVARRNQESELVEQRIHLVDQSRKSELLATMITDGEWEQVLVFTRTKHGANRLAKQLVGRNVNADAIHGNKSQSARTRALAGFKTGEVRVLVATDIASRGLDIEQLPHVVNFDLPIVPEDYVHRIGRTGRAGSTGEAISLVSTQDLPLLLAIEKMLTRKLERSIIPGFELGTGSAHDPGDPGPPPRQMGRRPGTPERRPAPQPTRFEGRSDHFAAADRNGAGRNASAPAPRPAHGVPAGPRWTDGAPARSASPGSARRGGPWRSN